MQSSLRVLRRRKPAPRRDRHARTRWFVTLEVRAGSLLAPRSGGLFSDVPCGNMGTKDAQRRVRFRPRPLVPAGRRQISPVTNNGQCLEHAIRARHPGGHDSSAVGGRTKSDNLRGRSVAAAPGGVSVRGGGDGCTAPAPNPFRELIEPLRAMAGF